MKRVSIHTAQDLETKVGKIIKSTVVGNLGLVYTLEVETANINTGALQTWIVKTGGETGPFEMFCYNFTSTNWDDHLRVGIQSIERKKTMKDSFVGGKYHVYSYDSTSSSVKTSLNNP